MEPQNKPNKTIGIAIGIVGVLLIGGIVVFANKKPLSVPPTNDQTSSTLNAIAQNTPTPTTPQNPPADTTKPSATIYKDGTYTATGSYMSPGGEDQIAVTLTLADDIVTSATVTPEPSNNTSKRYADMFAANYQPYVVGKNIADINLTKVSGSSLTPAGFDDALSQIKAQAQA